MNINDGDISGTGEFAIGFGGGGEASNLDRLDATRRVNAALTDLVSQFDQIKQYSVDRIQSCITECRGPIDECRSCLEGRIERRLAEPTGTIAGITERLLNSIVQRISEASGAYGELLQSSQSPQLFERDPTDPPIYGGGGNVQTVGSGTIEGILGGGFAQPPSVPGQGFPPAGGGSSGGTVGTPSSAGDTGGGNTGTGKCPDGSPMHWTVVPGSAVFPGIKAGATPTLIDCTQKNQAGDCGVCFSGADIISTPISGGGGDAGDGSAICAADPCQLGTPGNPLCIRFCGPESPTEEPTEEPMEEPTEEPTEEPGGGWGICEQEDGTLDWGWISDEIEDTAPIVNPPDTGNGEIYETFGRPASGNDSAPPPKTDESSGSGGPIEQPGPPAPGKGCVAPPPNAPPQPNPGNFDAFCDPERIYPELTDSYYTGKTSESMMSAIRIGASEAVEKAFASGEPKGWIESALLSFAKMLISAFVYGYTTLVAVGSLIMPTPRNCSGIRYWFAVANYSLANVAHRLLGLVPPTGMRHAEYIANASCPTGVLSTAEAISSLLRGEITEEQAQRVVEMNGDCWPWFERLYKANLFRPDWQQVISLYRGNIIDKKTYEQWLIRTGIGKDFDKEILNKLFEAVPTYDDIVRFMVRDVDDPEAIKLGNLDQDFEKKWTGKVKEWSERQGLHQDKAIRYWRAHWVLPSPTALYEMLIRLRPGRGAKTPDGVPVEIDAEKIRSVLKQNDMAPGWVDAMMALAHRPMTRIDLRRAYEISVIDEPELLERIKDLGYDDVTSRRLVEFFKKTLAEKRAKLTGAASQTNIKSWYMDGIIDDAQAMGMLIDGGIEQIKAQKIVGNFQLDRKRRDAVATIPSLRSAYFGGRLDDSEYVSELVDSGISPPRAAEIMQRDSRIKEYKNKQLTIANMCKLVGQGYLSIDEYLRRASNLGYKQSDAAIMAASCVQDIVEKRTKEMEAEQRKAVAEAEKAERKADREARRINRQLRAMYPCRDRRKPECVPPDSPPPQMF